MHSIHVVTARTIFYMWALTTAACSVTRSIPLINPGPPHELDSFIGIRFGDSIDHVERQFPTGLIQTSPYGAPAYKLENVSSGNIEYQDVIYEFQQNVGMQMVIAHFEPSAGTDLFQQLQTTLGPPVSASSGSEGSASGANAAWRLSDGSRVIFDGPFHRLVLIGKNGGSLETDIRLRDQFIPAVS